VEVCCLERFLTFLGALRKEPSDLERKSVAFFMNSYG